MKNWFFIICSLFATSTLKVQGNDFVGTWQLYVADFKTHDAVFIKGFNSDGEFYNSYNILRSVNQTFLTFTLTSHQIHQFNTNLAKTKNT